jgi:hypothetical protein
MHVEPSPEEVLTEINFVAEGLHVVAQAAMLVVSGNSSPSSRRRWRQTTPPRRAKRLTIPWKRSSVSVRCSMRSTDNGRGTHPCSFGSRLSHRCCSRDCSSAHRRHRPITLLSASSVPVNACYSLRKVARSTCSCRMPMGSPQTGSIRCTSTSTSASPGGGPDLRGVWREWCAHG